MGKPAARLMDTTAHGGMITGPGVPTVMVGKMPAGGLGDMHVCPMVTGVVPHVGGPMTLGSMGVLIGKKPAGRITDMSVCVGPPSLVLMGCTTVLIGEMGGGGGGAGAGAAAAAAAVKTLAPGSVGPFPLSEPGQGAETHFNRFQFQDASGRPLAGIPCKWKDSDGKEGFAVSDPDGRVQANGLSGSASFSVEVGLLKKVAWSKPKPKTGETVKIKVEAEAIKDGADIICFVYASSGGGPGSVAKRFDGRISGNAFEAEWDGVWDTGPGEQGAEEGEGAGEEEEDGESAEGALDADGAEAEPPLDPDPESAPTSVQYRCLAYCGNGMAVSDPMEFFEDLELSLVDEMDEAIPEADYKVVLSSGEVKTGKLDKQGKATIPGVPAGAHKVMFPDAAEEPIAPPTPLLAVLEMEDVLFRHDSAIFMPTSVEDTSAAPADQETISGLAVLKTAIIRLQEFPTQSLLVSGHTDTSGGPAYNFGLSDQRAAGVVAMLEGDRAAWKGIAQAKHKTEDVQHILKWTAETRGWNCDPGDIDGRFGTDSRTALEHFQAAYNGEFSPPIGVDGRMGPDTWGAFFDVQQADLARLLGANASAMASYRTGLRWMDPSHKSVGCGESWPIDQAQRDNFRSQTNRRVELLFFEPEDAVPLACHGADGRCRKERCPLYPVPPARREYLPVHPHPHAQGTPEFLTLEQPGAANYVRMHSLTAYMALFDDAGALESAQRFKFREGKLADFITDAVTPIDCNRQAWFYFSHREDLLLLDRAQWFKQDRSGLPLLGPIDVPCGQGAEIRLDIWAQNDWAVLHAVRVDGERPERVLMAEWKENYITGHRGVTADGTPGFWPSGDCGDKDRQETWKTGSPIELKHLGNPGSNPLWAGTLSALPTAKAKLLLEHVGPNATINAGSFNEIAPTGANQEFQSHHRYDQARVRQLEALPHSGQGNAAIDALPNPPARALLPGDMCWQDQGQTNNCGAYSFSTAMNYWFPYTSNPERKNGALYARPGNVDDTINGARTPADIQTAAGRFRMNGSDHDAESLDRARALKLIKSWIAAGVPVVFLVKEEYNLWSYHWKTLAGYDGDRFFMNNSGADREVIVTMRRSGTQYEQAPVGNDVDPEADFYGKWRAAGGDIVDAFTSVDECTFLPLYPRDGMFGGTAAR